MTDKSLRTLIMNTTKYLGALSFLLLCQYALGQEENNADQDSLKVDPDSSGVVNDVLRPISTPILLFTALEDEEETKKEKKKKTKKKKKNIYFGERTQRSSIKE